MTSHRLAGLLACSWLIAVAGCDERSLLGNAPPDAGAADARADVQDGPASSRADGGDASLPSTPSLPAGFVAAPYIAVTRVPGTCASPDGQPYGPASAGEAASLLVGRWQHCSGSTLVPGVRDGMELARDRRWRSLADVNGALLPVAEADSEGVWYLSAEDPNDMVNTTRWVVRIGTAQTFSATGYSLVFLQDPSKIQLGASSIYVWLGE